MINTSRNYAEGLVGPLDRSSYQTQRDVSQNTYNTNWQAIQNQYKILQEKLKSQQDTANKDYANNIANVVDNSFSRTRDTNNNLVNKGLTVSGLNDIKQQAETAQKGTDVLKLLDKVGNSATDVVNQLGSANSSLASKEANLNNSLGNTLGTIGAKDVSTQMNYNKILANLAGAKDTRDMNNKLAAEQRAANAASMSANSSTNKAKEALNDFYKKASINEILSSGSTSDADKKSMLATLFGIKNSGDVVDNFNTNAHASENYNNQLDALNKELNNLNSTYKPNGSAFEPIGSLTNAFSGYKISNAPQIKQQTNSDTEANRVKIQDAIDALKQKGINYTDLAMLYGSN